MSAGPTFQPLVIAPSSAHSEYHKRAIQFYGRPRFEGRSAHQDDYPAWELPERVQYQTHKRDRPALPFDAVTTYADVYKQHQLEPRSAAKAPASPADRRAGLKFDAHTSYADEFSPKTIPRREPFDPSLRARPRGPAKFEGVSSYADEYPAYEIDPENYRREQAGQRSPYNPRNVPFDGVSAYKDSYVEHPLEPHHHALSGPVRLMRSAHKFEGSTTHGDDYRAWEVPTRREGLGVAIVGDRFYVYIPARMPVPAEVKQTFTTVHDGQTEMCYMIYEGSNPVASKNRLLGQFQLANVPPAPYGVPRVQVTFNLDANNRLRVEAVDLASKQRHVWDSLKDGHALSHAPTSLPHVAVAIAPDNEAGLAAQRSHPILAAA